MSGFVYIASPYTHADPEVREQRYREAVRFLRFCLVGKSWAYSPIVQTHDAAKDGGLPYEFEFWLEYDRTMIRAAHGVFVLCIDGWRASKGIANELLFAAEIGKPVFYAVEVAPDAYDLRNDPPA